MWQMEQTRKCSTCNTFDWEWEEDPETWVAGLHLCLGCRSLELESQSIKDAVHPEGYKLRLYREKEDDGI